MLQGCGKHLPPSPVMARVGDDALTYEEALGHIDTTMGDRNVQLRQYIASWVTSELLYQEAKRKGIENSGPVNRQLDEIRRHLATQSYLEQYVYHDTTSIPDDTLRAYFENHGAEFFIREDVKQLNIALLNNREKASTFAAAVAQGTAWKVALAAFMKDTASAATLLSSSGGRYYSVHTIIPPELWKVTQALANGEVSFPVKTESGYVVVQVIRIFKQGAASPFEFAKDEILQRVLLERRRKTYDDLLKSLRNRYSVQIYFSPSADSTVHHE
jgi:hypothetical protein